VAAAHRADRHGRGLTWVPVAVEIQLRQDPREVAPLVQLYVMGEESRRFQTDLTLTEAGKLAAALRQAVMLAGD
jgi:hypothetical protein